ncbi:hypothetical protein AGMMS4957_01260 [Bacteroidia bacterium]|nr:hypothetical protein AGMMS4957_01260 [Bacteroidia bacterium]
MKKCLSIVLPAALLLFTGCIDADSNYAVRSVTLDNYFLYLNIGQKAALAATVLPSNANNRTVSWSSSDDRIVKVDAYGRVTAVASGTAIVTASAGKLSDYCDVWVSQPVRGISVSRMSLELIVGENAPLVATVSPSNADDKTVVWSSSNSRIATVNASGRITAVALGEATITATAGAYGATCQVEVVMQDIPMVAIAGGVTEINGTMVSMSSFKIGKYEVTQSQWKKVMGNTSPSAFKGNNLPVESVNFTDIQRFLARLNQQTKANYRLPTEVEWEYAAKGGQDTHNYQYSGSNNVDDVAWYQQNGGAAGPQIVGTKAPNELGIYDMSGNVFEWCSDRFSDIYPSGTTDPTGPDPDPDDTSLETDQMIRGGCWQYTGPVCAISVPARYYVPSNTRENYLGFRVAHSL